MASSAREHFQSIPLGVFMDCEMIERSSSSILRVKVAHNEKSLARDAGDYFDIAFRPKDLERLKGAIVASARTRDLFHEEPEKPSLFRSGLLARIFGR